MKKFRIGHTVVPSNNTPKWLLSIIRRNRSRTVVGYYYDKSQEHILYYLGSNNHGKSDIIAMYPFRANQLKRYIRKPIGRPLSKKRIRKIRALKMKTNTQLPITTENAPVLT